jgi:hypothetical protein
VIVRTQSALPEVGGRGLNLEQNVNILALQLRENSMSDLVHDLVSFISIGAFITTLALWLVVV